MGEVVRFKKPKPGEKHQGKTLCAHGFHKWKTVTANRFDVKTGRLVTAYVCERCGALRNEAR
jgi:hypothetical protein